MAGKKAYGRAFPIRKADVGAYRMTQRPNGGYRPNPMGVTTLASVNGRGAYSRAHGSARAATQGLSRTERVARARRLMENRSGSMNSNVHRAAFVRRMNENSRRGAKKTRRSPLRRNKRPATAAESKAYTTGHERIFPEKGKKRAAPKRAAPKAAAAATAAPKKRHTSKGVKAAERSLKAAQAKLKRAEGAAAKAVARADVQAKRAVQRAEKAKVVAANAKKRAEARKAHRSTPAYKKRVARKRAKSRWPTQTRTVRRGGKTRRVRVAYGPYRRAKVYDSRRGKMRASYMSLKGRRLRKIPAWAIAGAISAKDYKTEAAYEKAKARIAARRKAAAARVERGMDAFTPNTGAKMASSKKKKKSKKKGSRKAGKRKSAKRVAAGKKAARTRKRRSKAKAASPKRKTKRKTRRKTKRVSSKRKTKRKTRRKTKRASSKRKTRRKSSKRRSAPRRIGRRKIRRLKRGMYFVSNTRRRHGRKSRRHSGRKLLSNRGYLRNGFSGDLMSLLKTGGLILAGFFAHRALTVVVTKALTDAAKGTFAGMSVVGTDGKPTILAQWNKPITGAVVGGASIFGISMVKAVKAETRMAVSAGIMVSFLESLVRTALEVAEQPQALSYLSGYSNSAAYSLRGARGRRSMRGLGLARNAVSTLPQFTPIGAFTQAAAGMGEFFVPRGAAGMGEYFAGPGVQGVGHYEKAGPLALQPSRSHMGQLPVDDGIRPDANLDHIMDLAESAAGLGQGFQQAAAGFSQAAAGMGEFFTASPDGGGFAESTVPTQSQWIPNGPLWAGSTPAEAHYTESELPAGVLQGSGGNGVLSG